MNNFLSVMNKYNETDAQYLKSIVSMNALVGVPCKITTAEEFADWCEKTLAKRDEAGMREEVERLLKEIEWRERRASEIRAEIGE